MQTQWASSKKSCCNLWRGHVPPEVSATGKVVPAATHVDADQ